MNAVRSAQRYRDWYAATAAAVFVAILGVWLHRTRESNPPRRDPRSGEPLGALEEAQAALEAGEYLRAERALERFLAGMPPPELASTARHDLFLLLVLGSEPRPGRALEVARELERDPGYSDTFSYLYCRGIARRQAALERVFAAGFSGREERAILDEGAVWRYREGTTAPPEAWHGADFDDSDWREGRASIGYGDGDDRTELAAMRGRSTSLFLRAEVLVPAEDLEGALELLLRVRFDDGFVAYLNGVELARTNVPGIPGEVPPFDATALSTHEAGDPESFTAPLGRLAPGRNVLAVAVFNASSVSSDLTFDASLALPQRPGPLWTASCARDLEAARGDLERAAGMAPALAGKERALVELAAVLLAEGRYEEAGEKLVAIAESAPDDIRRSALYLHALGRYLQGDVVAAGRTLARLVPFGGGLQEVHARYLLGRVHHRLGELPEALEKYTRVEDLLVALPSGGGPIGEGLAARVEGEARLFRAVALFELGKRDEATGELSRLATAAPASSLARSARLFHAIALLGSGRAQEADAEFYWVARTESDPDSRARAFLWASRAAAQHRDGAPEWLRDGLAGRVAGHLDEGLAVVRDEGLRRTLASERAGALLENRQYAKALAAFEELATRGGAGENAEERGDLAAEYGRVVALQNLRRHAEALELCRDARERASGRPYAGPLRLREAESCLLQALETPGDERWTAWLDAAGAAYTSALETPGLSLREHASFRLGLVELLRGRPREAESVLARAARRPARQGGGAADPQLAAAHYFRARCLIDALAEPARDALSGARLLRAVEEAEQQLLAFLAVRETSERLRAKAALALVQTLHRRGAVLADPQARQSALTRAYHLAVELGRRTGGGDLGAEVRIEEARILASSGNLERASRVLEAFRSENPWRDAYEAPLALLELARLRAAAGKPSESIAAAGQARERLEALDSGVDGSSAPRRRFLGALVLERARALRDAGRPGEAIDVLEGVFGGGFEESLRLEALAVALEIALEEEEDAPGRTPERPWRSAQAFALEARGFLERGAAISPELEAELVYDIARARALAEEPSAAGRRDLAWCGRRLGDLAGPSDPRRIAFDCLEAALLAREGRFDVALARLEDAYAASEDARLDDEILVRRAACRVAADRTGGAVEELASLRASATGLDERVRAAVSGVLDGGGGGAPSAALALLALPIRLPPRAAGELSRLRSSLWEHLADIQSLELEPLPHEEVELPDPLARYGWTGAEHEPPIVPILEPAQAGIVEFALLAGERKEPR